MTSSRREFLAGLAVVASATDVRALASAGLPRAREVIADFVARETFNGVISLGQSGRIVHAEAFGMADVEAAIPTRTDTRYAIGSISKWLTTAVVLRLVDGRRLSLDAPIATWIPKLRPATGAKVSLRHLLSNTSGIPDALMKAVRSDPSLRRSSLNALEIVTRYAGGELLFEPGSKFDYGPQNWVLVRAIVEQAEGRPFESVVQDRLLTPLRLTRTTVTRPTGLAPAASTAAAYEALRPAPVRDMDLAPPFAAASGTFHAPAGDLCRAVDGVLRPGFLSSASRGELLAIRVPEESYALGGRVRRLSRDGREDLVAWETGASGGYKSLVAQRLSDRRAVVVLNNTDMAQKTINVLAEALFAVI